ncbi:hypothetical protein RISK_002550 [Rhodopirellula islandica]|uniref:Uncharacterized protein n=1 Tax=Rhodopirellula islandica TaxID=595434 RepID=A0A0J1BFH5_RHOIS|nr:hypothetical protein RISK_002550 [Rhodopirellula islandica]
MCEHVQVVRMRSHWLVLLGKKDVVSLLFGGWSDLTALELR